MRFVRYGAANRRASRPQSRAGPRIAQIAVVLAGVFYILNVGSLCHSRKRGCSAWFGWSKACAVENDCVGEVRRDRSRNRDSTDRPSSQVSTFCSEQAPGPVREWLNALSSLFIWVGPFAVDFAAGGVARERLDVYAWVYVILAVTSFACHASLGKYNCALDRVSLTQLVWLFFLDEAWSSALAQWTGVRHRSAIWLAVAVAALALGTGHGVVSSGREFELLNGKQQEAIAHRQALFLVGATAVVCACWSTLPRAKLVWKVALGAAFFLVGTVTATELEYRFDSPFFVCVFALCVVSMLAAISVKEHHDDSCLTFGAVALLFIGFAFREVQEQNDCDEVNKTFHTIFHIFAGGAFALNQYRLAWREKQTSGCKVQQKSTFTSVPYM